ncbi:MAG: GAF domain-containing protein [Prevotella sp.]|nr:GAF domain-containing protein [Prevotellaceae bacterium]MDY3365564.1 GAF domain-containing protein [Prevotella sp.]MDY3853314.1 GAF domain-containing protein [Prevotella sp.]
MDKKKKYEELIPQVKALIENETDEVGVQANVAAALHQAFDDYFWTGFYMQRNGNMLRLGPFQGPPACYSIPIGKGVCGTAFAQNKTIVVPDVELFPGHIACSSLSRSEIVVPIHNGRGEVIGVLDIDSKKLNAFDETDASYLEKIMQLLTCEVYSAE